MTPLSSLALSRDDSQIIKGLAILLMILHHYSMPLVKVMSDDCGLICWMGKACVSLFAFVTGYGLSVRIFSSPTVPRTASLCKSLASFWKIYLFCMVFVTVFTCIFPHPEMDRKLLAPLPPSSILRWVLSLTMLFPHLYNWWYASAFAWMVLCFAPAMAHCRRVHYRVWKCLPVVFVACLPFLLALPQLLDGVENLVEAMGASAQTVVVLLAQLKGMVVFLPWMIFGICYYIIVQTRGGKRLLAVGWLALLLLIWSYFIHPWYATLTWVSVGAIGGALVIRQSRHLTSFLGILGRYSVWMWLIHQFIFGLWFKPFFYRLNPVLGYCLVVFIALVLSVVLDRAFCTTCLLASRIKTWLVPCPTHEQDSTSGHASLKS